MAEESNLQSKILKDLRSFGKYCECFKIMKTSDNGEPDIFFTTRCTGAVLIETKRVSGSVEKLQKFKIKKLNDCGTQTFICRSWNKWIIIKNHLHLNKSIIEFAHDLETHQSML